MEPTSSSAPLQNDPLNSGGGNARIMAIASLVLGVINLCAWFLPICGIPLSIVGLVLGFLGMKSPSQKTLAIIGLALCGFGLLLGCGNAVFGAYLGLSGGLQNFQFAP
jgi:membrane-bound ClpP family serine protease